MLLIAMIKYLAKTSDARKGLFWLTVWGNTVHRGWKEYEMAGHIAAAVRKKRDEFWCSQLAYFLSTYIQSQCHAHSGPVFHPQLNWKAPYSYTQRCVS